MRPRKDSQDYRSLLGTRPGIPPGMANYIVSLREEEDESQESPKRSEWYEAGIARTARFQRKLKGWLNERGLESQVANVGEPTVFPLVMLTCTPEVAKQIAMIPEVVSVVRDTEDLSFLP